MIIFFSGKVFLPFCQWDNGIQWCYIKNKNELNFDDAKRFCARANGRLFEPRNKNNQIAVHQGADALKNGDDKIDNFWIAIYWGGNDWVYDSTGTLMRISQDTATT